MSDATKKHTPEPWAIGAGSHVCGMWSGMIRIESTEDFHSNGVDYPDGSTKSYTNVVCGTTGGSDTARANMLRIVACVNACAGIADPAAAIEGARVAMRAVLDSPGLNADDLPGTDEAIDALRTALAALGTTEGGATNNETTRTEPR